MQALLTGRPKLGLGGDQGVRGRYLPLIPPSALASSQMKMQIVPASQKHNLTVSDQLGDFNTLQT